MKTHYKALLLLFATAFAGAGCSVGDAPSGMSGDEARANFEQQKPEEQIRLIQASPASAQEKATRIAEIRKKNNLPDTGTTPAPATSPQGGGTFPGDPRGSK